MQNEDVTEAPWLVKVNITSVLFRSFHNRYPHQFNVSLARMSEPWRSVHKASKAAYPDQDG